MVDGHTSVILSMNENLLKMKAKEIKFFISWGLYFIAHLSPEDQDWEAKTYSYPITGVYLTSGWSSLAPKPCCSLHDLLAHHTLKEGSGLLGHGHQLWRQGSRTRFRESRSKIPVTGECS